MISILIPGLSENAVNRYIEILEAGLLARAPHQAPHQIRAERRMVDYLSKKLKEAK